MIQYPFAIDEAGVLVSIDSVDAEHRHEHSYRCPECGGEMRPRLGQQRSHCFYHSDDHECDVESYVHKVGKELLYKRFLTDGIPVRYVRKQRCVEFESCSFKQVWTCEYEGESKDVILAKHYDLAEIEKAYGEFRPDVLLTSTKHPDRPFFLEVCHKHPCSEEKKASGYPIMEVTVNKVSDLKLIQSIDVFSSVADCPLKVVFYGIRPEYIPIESYIKASKPVEYRGAYPCTDKYKRKNSNLIRVSFFPSGKTFRPKVISFEEAHNDKALFEITYDQTSLPRYFRPEELIARKNPLYRTCDICCNCISNWDENTWCRNVLNGSSRKGTFDKLKARKCGAFTPRGMLPEGTFGVMKEDIVNYDLYLPGRDFDYWFNPKSSIDNMPRF